MKTCNLGIEVGLQLISFIIPLCTSYIRHSWGNYWRLLRYLLKEIQIFVRLLQQKDCQSTAEVNNAFKLLPQQKDCWVYSWNSNTVWAEKICNFLKNLLLNKFLFFIMKLWRCSFYAVLNWFVNLDLTFSKKSLCFPNLAFSNHLNFNTKH